MAEGVVVSVGGRKDRFCRSRNACVRYYHEDDENSFYYDEMCGHRWLLGVVGGLMDRPFVGLEHYRRYFDMSAEEICRVLQTHDCIVKDLHGPYGTMSNLEVLGGCSRHHINYLPLARGWVERFPELQEQASATTHWGCSMLICRPDKYREIMEDEFRIIDELLKTPGLTKSSIGYFCETILTPAMIRKHCKNPYVGPVIVKEREEARPRCVLGVLSTPEGRKIEDGMGAWLSRNFEVIEVWQTPPGTLYEYPAIKEAASLAADTGEPVLYIHTKGAASLNDAQPAVRAFWEREFGNGIGPYADMVNVPGPMIAAPFASKEGVTWFNAFVMNPMAGRLVLERLRPSDDRYTFERVPQVTGCPFTTRYGYVGGEGVFGLMSKIMKGEIR
jgi:hypothetical protein